MLKTYGNTQFSLPQIENLKSRGVDGGRTMGSKTEGSGGLRRTVTLCLRVSVLLLRRSSGMGFDDTTILPFCTSPFPWSSN